MHASARSSLVRDMYDSARVVTPTLGDSQAFPCPLRSLWDIGLGSALNGDHLV